MTSPQDVQQFVGRSAVDSEGRKVAKIGQVYLDEQTGMPLRVTVATGMFGTRQSLAPLYGARVSGDEVTLAVSKEQIKDAPKVDDDGQIDASEQDTLRAERPVVAKEAVPVERVRLTTETVFEDAAVNETVRKEQIEEPGVEGSPRDAGR